MTARTEPPEVLDDYEEEGHKHPPDSEYVIVAAILAVLTAIEVGLYYIEELDFTILAGALGTLMIIKFGMVIMFFMHLRYDNKLFRRVFLTGVFLAVAVYVAVLMMFHVFLR